MTDDLRNYINYATIHKSLPLENPTLPHTNQTYTERAYLAKYVRPAKVNHEWTIEDYCKYCTNWLEENTIEDNVIGAAADPCTQCGIRETLQEETQTSREAAAIEGRGLASHTKRRKQKMTYIQPNFGGNLTVKNEDGQFVQIGKIDFLNQTPKGNQPNIRGSIGLNASQIPKPAADGKIYINFAAWKRTNEEPTTEAAPT